MGKKMASPKKGVRRAEYFFFALFTSLRQQKKESLFFLQLAITELTC